jgi:hypothetical protein
VGSYRLALTYLRVCATFFPLKTSTNNEGDNHIIAQSYILHTPFIHTSTTNIIAQSHILHTPFIHTSTTNIIAQSHFLHTPFIQKSNHQHHRTISDSPYSVHTKIKPRVSTFDKMEAIPAADSPPPEIPVADVVETETAVQKKKTERSKPYFETTNYTQLRTTFILDGRHYGSPEQLELRGNVRYSLELAAHC